MMTAADVAAKLGHPVGNRTTDVQLIAAVQRGHLGRARIPTPGGTGSLTEGLAYAARLEAKRSGLFAMARHLLGLSAPVPLRRTWRLNRAKQLDQGDTPMCVAYAKAHWNLSLPVGTYHPSPATDYARAKQVDGYPGEDGTDAAAMLKVAVEEGVVDSTWWWSGPQDTAALDRWLLTIGPVWLGSYWSEPMFRTDAKGMMNCSGALLYGHEVLVIARDVPRKLYGIVNSWGPGFGVLGRGFMRDADFLHLLYEGGDAVGVVERKP